MKNIKSWFTTIAAMVLFVLICLLYLKGEVSIMHFYIGIGVSVLLLFFKDEWASQLWKAVLSRIKKSSSKKT